jgi:hypothetical protein
MAITGVCYCTREDVKTALDIKETARVNAQVDRALAGARDSVETLCNRKFYPQADTRFFDWPNYDRAYPWRLWLYADEVISVSALSSGGTVIPQSQYFLRAGRGYTGPPFTYIELDRSTSAAFRGGATPQRSVSVTGVFGFGADTAPAGALAAPVTDTTGTSVTLSDSSRAGAGSSLLIDSERMLVTDTAMVTTAQAQQGAGAGTAVASDVALTVTDGTKYAVGEVLLLDSERMRIADIAGNVLTVKRAWDGSVLATHSGATIFAPRLLTVTRGALGTTAATHLNAAPAARHAVPGIVAELAVAEAINLFLQETSGYARTVGAGDNVRMAGGAGLADLRARCLSAAGRKSRQRTI